MFWSPVVIAVPASYPNKVLSVGFVESKLSPAFSPILVFLWASVASIPLDAVTIPALTTIPPVVTLNPFPAVTIPIESTFVASSYVIVPAQDILPVTVKPPPT